MTIVTISFVILVIVILVLLLGLSFIFHWLTRFKKGKLIKWVLGGYVLLLLFATMIYYFNPPQAIKAVKPLSADEVYKADFELFQALEEEDLNRLNPAYVLKEWTFKTEEEELFLSKVDPHVIGEIVLVQTDLPSNEIRIRYYRTPLNMDGWDISPYLSLPEINFMENRLDLVFPRKELHLSKLDVEFPLKQFQDRHEAESFIFQTGSTALLIYHPEGKTVHVDSVHSVHRIQEK